MKPIIFIAPPAAGKGTVSDALKQKYNLAHISTGDLLREAVAKGDENGLKIKEILDKGQLVSNEIVLDLLKSRIMQDDCKNGYILDGFPRTIEQAEEYENILASMNKELGFVIFLEVDKELAKKRTIGRVSCTACGAIFNTILEDKKPKVENICDRCGATLTKRSDDNEETFNQRFDTYFTKTAPLIEYYEKKGALYRVDGNSGSDVALKIIEEIIK